MSQKDAQAATTGNCFARADANHDGVVTFEEFEIWFPSAPASSEVDFFDVLSKKETP